MSRIIETSVATLVLTLALVWTVLHVQQTYRHRRLSASSISSSVVSDLTPMSAPTTPLTISPQLLPPVTNSTVAKVLGQSDSVTQYEQAGLTKILERKVGLLAAFVYFFN